MDEILYNVIINLIASGIFVAFLFHFLKPSVRISKQIAKRMTDGKGAKYTFKIINDTHYEVTDIKFQLALRTPRNIPEGTINDVTILAAHEIFKLDAPQKTSEPFSNEHWFTYENLEEKWNDENQHLVVSLICKHSLSQFSKVFTQIYYRKGSDIKVGQFKNGPFLEVVENG